MMTRSSQSVVYILLSVFHGSHSSHDVAAAVSPQPQLSSSAHVPLRNHSVTQSEAEAQLVSGPLHLHKTEEAFFHGFYPAVIVAGGIFTMQQTACICGMSQ